MSSLSTQGDKVVDIFTQLSSVLPCFFVVPPEVAPIVAVPTSLVTPTANVTLVCTIVSNPQVTSVVWMRAVGGGAPSTVSETSRMSEEGQYDQVTTTSTVVVQARGVEEQVRMGWRVAARYAVYSSTAPPHPSPSLPAPSSLFLTVHIHMCGYQFPCRG